MARKPYKPDIEYIQKYYSYGTEAKVIEFKPVQKPVKPKIPKQKKSQKTTIYIDPVALCGLVVAVVMLVVMALGVVQFMEVCEQHSQMQEHLTDLKDENVRLQHDYYTHEKYNLEEIETTARALGMIPVEEAVSISINVTVPQREPEMTAWDEFVWFLSGLFA